MNLLRGRNHRTARAAMVFVRKILFADRPVAAALAAVVVDHATGRMRLVETGRDCLDRKVVAECHVSIP